MAAYEIAKMLALPFASLEPIIAKFTLDRFLEAGGIANAASDNPVQERMTYTMTKQGRAMTEEMSKAGTHYLGPAPVTLADYNRMTTEVILPGLDPDLVRRALVVATGASSLSGADPRSARARYVATANATNASAATA